MPPPQEMDHGGQKSLNKALVLGVDGIWRAPSNSYDFRLTPSVAWHRYDFA